MSPIRTAVIGTGYLGEFHTQKYQQLKHTELVAIVDIDEKRAQHVAKQCKTQAMTDYQDLIGKVDAVSIVTPTQTHYDIGKFCLKNNIHVLMEKPIDEISAFADSIIHNKPAMVPGEAGKQALETALQITDMVQADLARRGLPA